jgi:hydrogenase maturation protease
MSKALVLACGNAQRGDDGVAIAVVNYLREDFRAPNLGSPDFCPPTPEFHCQQQWTPELAEPISRAEVVIFVDAAVGAPAGSVACRRLQPGPSASLTSTHITSPDSLLLLAEALYGESPARAYCITIAGDSFELEETLSDPVRRAISRSGGRIKTLLSEEAMPPLVFRAST